MLLNIFPTKSDRRVIFFHKKLGILYCFRKIKASEKKDHFKLAQEIKFSDPSSKYKTQDVDLSKVFVAEIRSNVWEYQRLQNVFFCFYQRK